MSSCKLGPKIRFSHIPIPPLIFHFISISKFSLISCHFFSFLFHFIPIGCLSARGRVLNSIPSNRHSGRSIYLLTTLTTLVAIVHYRILNEGPLPRGDRMCARRRELVFVRTSLIAVGRRRPSHREDALVEWVPAPYRKPTRPLQAMLHSPRPAGGSLQNLGAMSQICETRR